MTCIVAYDIDDNKLRGRLSRYLEQKGVRLQESVFAVEVERHAFRGMLKKLEEIAGKNRKVAVFRLCTGCQRNAVQMGGEEKGFWII